jgi:serine/threonine-protein kinase
VPDTPHPDPRRDEERLANALLSRGFLSREELQSCPAPPGGPAGAEALLSRLTASGLLTAGQARRAAKELSGALAQQIPGYELLERLGRGGMGTVYKARQLSMNRLVAVKILHPRLAANPEFIQRFQREAHLAARLSHNNIIQAIDVGSAGTTHYFVMELVQGKTIREELDAGKVFDESEALDIILQIAQALAHASRRGLVHRDVKPANIVLTPDGIAKLADLGLAREADDTVLARQERGLAFGTPHYISPEQIEGREDIDARCDLYSLGATLFHMVTGQPPFPDKDPENVFRGHLFRELTPPDHLNDKLSSGLGEVTEFLLAKDRRQRYQTADDLIIDLECLLAGEPPRLARQRIEAATLGGLAEGEEDEGEPDPPPLISSVGWVVIGTLAGLLFLSLLFNLILWARR